MATCCREAATRADLAIWRRTVDVLLFRDQSAGRLLGDIAHLTALATGEIEREGEQRGDLVPREGTSGSAASARAKGLTTAPPQPDRRCPAAG
jgi:hypothetical protein